MWGSPAVPQTSAMMRFGIDGRDDGVLGGEGLEDVAGLADNGDALGTERRFQQRQRGVARQTLPSWAIDFSGLKIFGDLNRESE
jgi:hypothetical protein